MNSIEKQAHSIEMVTKIMACIPEDLQQKYAHVPHFYKPVMALYYKVLGKDLGLYLFNTWIRSNVGLNLYDEKELSDEWTQLSSNDYSKELDALFMLIIKTNKQRFNDLRVLYDDDLDTLYSPYMIMLLDDVDEYFNTY